MARLKGSSGSDGPASAALGMSKAPSISKAVIPGGPQRRTQCLRRLNDYVPKMPRLSHSGCALRAGR